MTWVRRAASRARARPTQGSALLERNDGARSVVGERGAARAAAPAPQTPQRSTAVRTGASHSASDAASTAVTEIEQPAISSEVT
jgi:hypothetical protein